MIILHKQAEFFVFTSKHDIEHIKIDCKKKTVSVQILLMASVN
jgi:hypothetical protein